MGRGLGRFLRQNTIGMLALFIALGGTTYAASTSLIGKNTVASPQVVNGSLQTKDLSAKARTALKGNRGPRGLAGTRGATGPQGPQGVAGSQGAPGPTNTVLRAQADPDSNGSAFNLAGDHTVSTVSFTAPTNGVVTISNSVFVRNQGAGADELLETINLDGTSVMPSGWFQRLGLGAGIAGNFAGTVSRTVTAGNHTVTVVVNGTNYFYNAQELTALFTPAGNASTSSATTAPMHVGAAAAGLAGN